MRSPHIQNYLSSVILRTLIALYQGTLEPLIVLRLNLLQLVAQMLRILLAQSLLMLILESLLLLFQISVTRTPWDILLSDP